MREHLRERISGRGGQISKCWLWRPTIFVDMCFQQAVPSTADPREGSLQPIVLQHPHAQRMDEFWDSTETVLEQYWYCTGAVLEQH